MRLGVPLLLTVLGFGTSPARAEGRIGGTEAKAGGDGPALEAPYAPFAAVGVSLETGQALLFDERAGKYRIVEVGDVVAGWKIMAIQADEVVVTRGTERDELPIVAPPRTITGLPGGGAGGAAAKTPAKGRDEPKTDPAPRPTKSDAPLAVTVKRAELDRELGDFDKLGKAIDVSPAAGGGFVVTRVEKGSFPYRLGLRQGDVIRAVAGQRLASVDDAARVYARLRSLKTFTIEVDRPIEGAIDGASARLVLTVDISK
jgi:type II secretory pathway component PulC